MTIRLSLACGDYDRTAALASGAVRPLGVDLTVLQMPVEEIFFRMVSFGEFDAAELSLSSYLLTMADGVPGRFVAIPAFPSKSFRHSGIYISTKSKIRRPEDLVGRTVGLAEYQLTANVWIRGILAEHHGVPVESVRYRTGGLHTPGRIEKLPIEVPNTLDIRPIPEGSTLDELLVTGEIDAIYSPRTPRSFASGRPEVARLFPDFRAVEARYYRKTGIFPLMHTVVLRRDIYEANRWLARSLYDAFVAARDIAQSGIGETTALRYMLPWLVAEVEHTKSVMGPDYWAYGLPANRAALNTLVRYSFEQHLASSVFGPELLFAPETLRDTHI